MANYYSDHPEFDFYLNHPEMKRVVELKERNFADKDKYEDAPVDFDDAIENYKRVLDITGDIAANILEPNSEAVDLEGPHLVEGRMHYASKTYENIEATRQAGRWASPLRRSEHAYHSLFHGFGNRGYGRCRIPEHLELAGLYRDSL